MVEFPQNATKQHPGRTQLIESAARDISPRPKLVGCSGPVEQRICRNFDPKRAQLCDALLGWIAGDIMVTDPAIAGWVQLHAAWLREWHVASIGGALIVAAFSNSSHWEF